MREVLYPKLVCVHASRLESTALINWNIPTNPNYDSTIKRPKPHQNYRFDLHKCLSLADWYLMCKTFAERTIDPSANLRDVELQEEQKAYAKKHLQGFHEQIEKHQYICVYQPPGSRNAGEIDSYHSAINMSRVWLSRSEKGLDLGERMRQNDFYHTVSTRNTTMTQQHHPDFLRAQGLAQSMSEAKTEEQRRKVGQHRSNKEYRVRTSVRPQVETPGPSKGRGSSSSSSKGGRGKAHEYDPPCQQCEPQGRGKGNTASSWSWSSWNDWDEQSWKQRW